MNFVAGRFAVLCPAFIITDPSVAREGFPRATMWWDEEVTCRVILIEASPRRNYPEIAHSFPCTCPSTTHWDSPFCSRSQ